MGGCEALLNHEPQAEDTAAGTGKDTQPGGEAGGFKLGFQAGRAGREGGPSTSLDASPLVLQAHHPRSRPWGQTCSRINAVWEKGGCGPRCVSRVRSPSGVEAPMNQTQITLQQGTKIKATDGPLSGQVRACHQLREQTSGFSGHCGCRNRGLVVSQSKQILEGHPVGPCTPMGWVLQELFHHIAEAGTVSMPT